jgi:hypothetical protein
MDFKVGDWVEIAEPHPGHGMEGMVIKLDIGSLRIQRFAFYDPFGCLCSNYPFHDEIGAGWYLFYISETKFVKNPRKSFSLGDVSEEWKKWEETYAQFTQML